MKFLLVAINAKYIHSNPAIYSLRAYAGEELRPYIELAEYTINEQLDVILGDIYDRQPDVIAFSCYIWNINYVKQLLLEIPKVLPDTKLWLGGPEVSFDAPVMLEAFPLLTGIMVGEGEATFRELLSYYVEMEQTQVSAGKSEAVREEKSLKNIPGLCLPDGYTAARAPLDLTTIPFLYEDMTPFANRIIYYESSRGCPYSCSYCLSSIDKRVRLRNTAVVQRELQFFLDQRVKQVKFVDRTFNCNREHTRKIWEYLREHDNGVTNFHFEVSADILNDEEISLLHSLRPGLVQLEIGVQSTNPETITAIHRVMDVEKLAGIVARIKEGNNVHQHLDLIVGLPYEDYESFGNSFDRVYEMQPDQLQMGFLKVLKGSFMYDHAKEYGIVYSNQAPYEVLYTNWVSYSKVRQLKRIEEMVELYYNSNQFMHALPFLVNFFEGAFAMFEALAAFYQEKNYFVNTPARAYRYHVLLEFGECYVPEAALDALKELLIYDMYLREKLKSRPSFAASLEHAQYKEYARSFYQREEQEHRYLQGYEGYDWKQLGKQTHLEPFAYPVWDVGQTILWCEKENPKHQDAAKNESAKHMVLFDYKNRNPLNHDAEVFIVFAKEKGER